MQDRAQLTLDIIRPCVTEGRADGLMRGVCRLLDAMGYCPLVEAPLLSGRRADILGQNRRGRFIIVEIKTGPADFRSDTKWSEYHTFCDQLYFAVSTEFPISILPETVGVIIGDRFGAEIIRKAQITSMTTHFRRRQAIFSAGSLPIGLVFSTKRLTRWSPLKQRSSLPCRTSPC